MPRNDAPVAADELALREMQRRGEHYEEEELRYWSADEESNEEDCEPPSAAEVTLFVEKEVVGFHSVFGILAGGWTNGTYGTDGTYATYASSPIVPYVPYVPSVPS